MIRDAAQAFAQDKLLPRVEEAYLNETSDPEIFPGNGCKRPFGGDRYRNNTVASVLPMYPTAWSPVKSNVLTVAIAR